MLNFSQSNGLMVVRLLFPLGWPELCVWGHLLPVESQPRGPRPGVVARPLAWRSAAAAAQTRSWPAARGRSGVATGLQAHQCKRLVNLENFLIIFRQNGRQWWWVPKPLSILWRRWAMDENAGVLKCSFSLSQNRYLRNWRTPSLGSLFTSKIIFPRPSFSK